MKNLVCTFDYKGINHTLELRFIKGTATAEPFLFGAEEETRPIQLKDFYLAKFQTTQALWKYVTADELKHWGFPGDCHPAEHVSWNDITNEGGFLARINDSDILPKINGQSGNVFRLPSETEWEYAARGGPLWKNDLLFGGSNDPGEVAWYLDNSGGQTHPVGQKTPNQLGLYDMNGNVWEWCQDAFIRDIKHIPGDGSAYEGVSNARILRGGCHHNGAIHCTNVKRYEIMPEFKDACIGFRLAMDA